MKVVIGTDHRGYKLKQFIVKNLSNIEWVDMGCFSDEQCDYPIFAQKVCQSILQGEADRGVLLCATGVGMAIAANRFNGIYAAVAWNKDIRS